jgi:hypothetical protein
MPKKRKWRVWESRYGQNPEDQDVTTVTEDNIEVAPDTKGGRLRDRKVIEKVLLYAIRRNWDWVENGDLEVFVQEGSGDPALYTVDIELEVHIDVHPVPVLKSKEKS